MRTCGWLVVVGGLLVGCGGSGSNPDGGNPDSGSPADSGTTMTQSGARSGTLTGGAPSSGYTPSVTAGSVSGTASSSTDQVSFTFGFATAPTTITYIGDSDAGVTCNVVDTVNATGDGWMANRGGGIPDLGTCSLTLSSVSLLSNTSQGQTYTVHGSVSATLAPRSGAASGNLTLSGSF